MDPIQSLRNKYRKMSMSMSSNEYDQQQLEHSLQNPHQLGSIDESDQF